MTNLQYSMLRYTGDTAFEALAKSYGFDVAGPHNMGRSWLVREPDGRAWLFGPISKRYGDRVVIESVWTDLNVAVMRGEYRET